MGYVLGVDAGGTKTAAVVSDLAGRALGVGKSGPANFQAVGVDAARAEVRKSVEIAIGEAHVPEDEIDFAFYGIAGADRPADFAAIEAFLREVNPARRFRLENDATIALRAATTDGVGVVAVCGTGTNVIGFNARGERTQIGGLGYMFGDGAGASHIGAMAIRMAARGRDGRGRPTVLYDMLCASLGLDALEDLVERFYPGFGGPPVDVARLAPLVFDAARSGDDVAREILRDAGRELACAILAALRRLFPADARVKIVLSGGVFANADDPVMVDTLKSHVLAGYTSCEFVLLKAPPVLGAVLCALDIVGVEVEPDVRRTLWETSLPRL